MEWRTPNPYVIDTRNVHTALPRAMEIILAESVSHPSRNGDVFVMDHPVMTVYRRPWERVLFWHERDANPYFHFMEALGFIGNVQDVEFYAQYAKQIRAYSDDGKTLAGNYGTRWRAYFDRDMLSWAIGRLRADPNDRRVVISMWDGFEDPVRADMGGLDVPCNTNIFLRIVNNRLDMMVNCRSNDILFGAYGANAVHMSVVQEYLASSIGVRQGRYYQNSFNWHAYRNFWDVVMNERSALSQETSLRRAIASSEEETWNPYASGELGERLTHPLMANTDHAAWDASLAIFLAGGIDYGDGLTDPFFTEVAVPLRESHAAYRQKQYTAARELALSCAAPDWRKGCLDWLERRAAERAARAAEQNRVDAAG
jgi:thymidylate synthase